MPPPSAHVSKIWSRSPLMCGGRQEGRKPEEKWIRLVYFRIISSKISEVRWVGSGEEVLARFEAQEEQNSK